MPTRTGTANFVSTGPLDTLFTLPVPWVEIDSVHVSVHGRPLAEFDAWRLLEPGNRIWLFRPLPLNDTLTVRFVYRPIPLYRIYSRHALSDLALSRQRVAAMDSSRVLAAPVPAAERMGWSRLTKSGSLIRSVQVGTGQDLALESALNLTVQGRVGKNIDVVAALTDQSTPIQPEGTTESLNELEKVFVTVRSPHLGATVGDYNLDYAGGRYDDYHRKLTGITGVYEDSVASVVIAAATSRGQFFSNSFSGQEANQGPYPLRDRNGNAGVLVLAGTERVWLDGEAMRRGEGNDYVIDYASGELTFTAKHVMTSAARVVVDFQYSNEDYERSFVNHRSSVKLFDGKSAATLTLVNETDSRDRPIGAAISASDRETLRLAGDDANAAIVSTADSVGAGHGDYVRADSTLDGITYSIFRFSERDSSGASRGQWQVVFDEFAAGTGDYEATADARGVTYFYWVGPGRGHYRPFRRLSLPKRYDLADVRLAVNPLAGLSIDGEAALSRNDLNTFSGRDDQNNDGGAYAVSGTYSRQKMNLLGIRPHSLSLAATMRGRNADFAEVNRAQETEFERDWDATRNHGTRELIREAEVRLAPVNALTFASSYGDLVRPHEQTTVRRKLSAGWRFARGWQTSASHLDIRADDSTSARHSDWIRQHGGVDGAVSRFAPRFALDRERKRDERRNGVSGFRFVDYLFGTGVDLGHRVSADAAYARRIDESLDNADRFRRSSRAADLSSLVSWQPPELGSGSLRYTHREKRFASADSANVVTDVGRMEATIAPRRRVVEGSLTYEAARSQSANQILVAVQVPAGTGNYRKDGDKYVPDDQGDYVLVPRNTGTFQPATDLNLSMQAALRPDELGPEIAGWLRALSTESEITIEERTRLPLTLRMALLDPSRFRGDSTLYGTLALRQDLYVLRQNRKLSFRLRYGKTESLQNQYLNGGQRRTLRELALRTRALYTSILRGETELGGSNETISYDSGVLPDRDIRRSEFAQNNSLSLTPSWELGLDLAAQEIRDERTATQVSLRNAKPRVALSKAGRARLDADVTWTHATANRTTIPFELASGANRGENFRWSVRGTYSFGQNFSGSITYTGRQDAGERTYHTGRVEARASL
jgi:hypothetical protein